MLQETHHPPIPTSPTLDLPHLHTHLDGGQHHRGVDVLQAGQHALHNLLRIPGLGAHVVGGQGVQDEHLHGCMWLHVSLGMSACLGVSTTCLLRDSHPRPNLTHCCAHRVHSGTSQGPLNPLHHDILQHTPPTPPALHPFQKEKAPTWPHSVHSLSTASSLNSVWLLICSTSLPATSATSCSAASALATTMGLASDSRSCRRNRRRFKGVDASMLAHSDRTPYPAPPTHPRHAPLLPSLM